MSATKQLIRKIHIHRFRSFGDIDIDAELLNIYSGKNNAGKSNILKALNLFFNNQTNYNSPYNHKKDYNYSFRGAAGGKREIKITLEFMPQGNGALKYPFSITRRFTEGSQSPETVYQSSNPQIEQEIQRGNGNITRQFTAYLNRIEYIYIPAVRDREFISNLLLNFEQIINNEAQGQDFNLSINKLSEVLSNTSKGVSEEFRKYIGIEATAALSSNTSDVLGATVINVYPGIEVRERSGKLTKEDQRIQKVPINLFSSGDGIVMSYLVFFLSYLTKRNNKNYIWGYEEPENSLEYSKVQSLAEEFYNKFTKNAQIFITTHSPAFINLMGRQKSVMYRVYQRPLSTPEVENGVLNRNLSFVQTISEIKHQLTLFSNTTPAYDALDRELHLAEQAIEIETRISELEKERKRNNEYIKAYERLIKNYKKLMIVSEGNNIDHIQLAIERINPKLLRKIELLKGLEDKSGVEQLKKYYDYECAKRSTNRVLFIFDCDAISKTQTLEETERVFVYTFRKNNNNKKVSGGIENLYPEDIIEEKDFIEIKELINSGSRTTKSINKQKFLEKLQSIDDLQIFNNYIPLIEKIEKCLNLQS